MQPGDVIEVRIYGEQRPRRALVCSTNGEDRASIRLERSHLLIADGHSRWAPRPLNVRLHGNTWQPA